MVLQPEPADARARCRAKQTNGFASRKCGEVADGQPVAVKDGGKWVGRAADGLPAAGGIVGVEVNRVVVIGIQRITAVGVLRPSRPVSVCVEVQVGAQLIPAQINRITIIICAGDVGAVGSGGGRRAARVVACIRACLVTRAGEVVARIVQLLQIVDVDQAVFVRINIPRDNADGNGE